MEYKYGDSLVVHWDAGPVVSFLTVFKKHFTCFSEVVYSLAASAQS